MFERIAAALLPPEEGITSSSGNEIAHLNYVSRTVDVHRALALCRGLGSRDLADRGRFALYRERLGVLIEGLQRGGQDGARSAYIADRATNP